MARDHEKEQKLRMMEGNLRQNFSGSTLKKRILEIEMPPERNKRSLGLDITV
jgi:hypothetical protein